MSRSSISAIIASAIRAMETEMRGIVLSVNDDAIRSLPLMTFDPVMIEQVVINLLNNAADAARSANASEPRVEIVSAVPDGNRLLVSVRDNGNGIAETVASRIYDAFVTKKPHGLGLGLCICRSIVEAHGGSLAHRGIEGGGTEFHFSLPVVSPEARTR